MLGLDVPAAVAALFDIYEGMGDLVIELAKAAKTQAPPHPSIKGRVDHFLFHSRTDFANPLVTALYSRAFFPELVRNFVAEFQGAG